MTDSLRPRILLTRRWPEAVERRLAERFDVTLNESDAPMDEAALFGAMMDHDALCPTVSDKIPASVIEAPGRRVKLIGNYGVGFNHIDIDACRRVGLPVSNTPGVLTDATADLALTLLLMTARRAGEGERELRGGRWSGWRPTHLIGSELKGRTLALVGFGRIAQATAERAHFGFGMEIAYWSRSRASAEVEARLGARHVADLDTLVAAADFLSLHVPGGAETRHLIDARRLALMKSTAHLVNTARGDVVDEAALGTALANGTIAGAALDVYIDEPRVNPALLDLENAVLLPHLGSATRETREAMGMKVLANLEAFFDGRELPDRVV